MATAFATCPLCEANCGIVVEHDGSRIRRIRGDADDWLSKGYICPKAVALEDVQHDPDRVRQPLRREGERWVETDWQSALEDITDRICAIQKAHGKSAVGLYVGNPTVHSYAAVLFGVVLLDALGTRSFFSSNSVDALPRLLVSYLAYGSQAVLPVPDLDRTHFLLILGANPLVSNGSVMTAPDCRNRLRAIRERGGRVVVVDPRRSETAEAADVHHFIRPGTDALLLAALLDTIWSENLASPGRISEFSHGLERVRELVRAYPPERVASVVGIDASAIRTLARDFAGAPSAVCYGRMGTSTQEFGALSTLLVDVLNAITGNLDRPGGAMFARPAVDLGRLAARIGQSGSFGRWRSRVSGMPEFNGETPVAALAEEIETPGDGQIRALITHAGNPVLSNPNGKRLARAFSELELMVSIDIYRNETTRHAHYILPPSFALEHDHYPLVFHALSLRNGAKYSPAVLPRPGGVKHEWEILLELARRVLAKRGVGGKAKALALGGLGRIGPRGFLDLMLRFGPYGRGRNGLTLERLKRAPHGVDLGPLVARLPEILPAEKTGRAERERRIQFAPEAIVADFARLARRCDELSHKPADAGGNAKLVLISRRQLRSNNSWMHNSLRLVRGRPACTLLMHPADAERRGISAGARVRIASRVGAIEADVELSDEVMPGVVSLPHGWGHDVDGVVMQVARRHAGVSVNDVTDPASFDAASGCTNLAVEVEVTPAVL